MSLLHSSTRRPAPLKSTDYDHEISLVDHTRPASPEVARSRSAGERPLSPNVSNSSSRRHSDVPLRKHSTPQRLRQEITKRKYSKYQDRRLGDQGSDDEQSAGGGPIEGTDEQAVDEEQDQRGRPANSGSGGKSKTSPKKPQSAIDILYENQRGGFLCGMALFSSRALGNADPSPWTNSAQKTSATNITNAQVPDPSWEWAWPEWHLNLEDGVDEEGWEYSFMFSKKFSWHKKSWWNSFVRRRAWIRQRVKKHTGYLPNQGHMLNSDYFTIHPADARSRSRASTGAGSQTYRYSTATLPKWEMDQGIDFQNIQDIGSLMKALKLARIDRERTEAVESFIKHGGDDLYYLRDHMHDIMGMFIFQASRRLLLSNLLSDFNIASEENESSEAEGDSVRKRRLENLEAAVKHADEEVQRLEFWSDVKDLAEKGLTRGAVDDRQGWDHRWAGIDSSGPRDVISEKKIPGTDNCKRGEGNGAAILDGLGRNHSDGIPDGMAKGRGKAKE
ncbi:hypothetical protein LZ554_001267 [Drepanopeziza brunnea f. sp. 'monogermtubi']|nr:hypothetical protein LZ554_001267 [Drepanopeziza brunnea f. sp. 'monogermtubi']